MNGEYMKTGNDEDGVRSTPTMGAPVGERSLEDLSFYRQTENNLVVSEPNVPPPETPPPTPPNPSFKKKKKKKKKGKAIKPIISDYEENYEGVNNSSPNENPYDFDFGNRNNDPLPIIVAKMRKINISLSLASFVFEIPFMVFKIFTPAKMVLAGYLGFMALLLLGFELHTPIVRDFLIDNFGILYSPLGRSIYMLLMGMLAFGQDAVLQMLLGILFMSNAVYTLVISCMFPDFKKVHEHPSQREDMLEKAREYGVKNNWVSSETSNLLNPNVNTGYGNWASYQQL